MLNVSVPWVIISLFIPLIVMLLIMVVLKWLKKRNNKEIVNEQNCNIVGIKIIVIWIIITVLVSIIVWGYLIWKSFDYVWFCFLYILIYISPFVDGFKKIIRLFIKNNPLKLSFKIIFFFGGLYLGISLIEKWLNYENIDFQMLIKQLVAVYAGVCIWDEIIKAICMTCNNKWVHFILCILPCFKIIFVLVVSFVCLMYGSEITDLKGIYLLVLGGLNIIISIDKQIWDYFSLGID